MTKLVNSSKIQRTLFKNIKSGSFFMLDFDQDLWIKIDPDAVCIKSNYDPDSTSSCNSNYRPGNWKYLDKDCEVFPVEITEIHFVNVMKQ